MAQCKYGVEYAYALLTSTLFKHNKHTQSKIEKRCPQPIQACEITCTTQTSETFGLTVGVNRFVEDTSQSQLSENVRMKDLELSQVTNYLATISQD